MKFLLAAIHAKYIHTGLAIYSLRSYAGKEMREHIEAAEYTINQRTDQILADIYRRRPDVIGFSCYIWNISIVKRLVRELAKLLPEVPIWLGGPEVSYEYEKIFGDYPEVTGIMIGEGEETFRELLRAYVDAGRDAFGRTDVIREVEGWQGKAEKREAIGGTREAKAEDRQGAGISKRAGNSSSEKEREEEQKDLRNVSVKIPGTVTREGFFGIREPLAMDRLPFYYEELEEAEKEELKNKIIYYESSRGCPFRCSYCLSSIDKQVRLRDTELVKRELRFFLDGKVKQVKFIDRTFNCKRKHALEIWRYLQEHDNGITNFHFEIAAELLTQEELELFSRMRPGLIQLEIGVQTTNRETLCAIHRPENLEKLKMTVMSIRGFRNIHQHLDLIAGLPFEDLASFRQSFNDVFSMKPDQLQLGFLKVLKGSEMFVRAEEYGIVYQSEPPYEVLYTKWLSYEDVQELKKVEEMLELFYNSDQFSYTLQMLQRFFEAPYDMFMALAEFYEEKGFFINSPSRNYRYEVMLEFVESWKAGEEVNKLFRELLTFDVYLREKAKSRPSFARDIHDRYQEISAFYRRQEKEPDLLSGYVEKGYDSRQMMRMTHMDVFCYPVWDEKWLNGIKVNELHPEGERFVLFDYERRSPLNHEARYTVIGRCGQ